MKDIGISLPHEVAEPSVSLSLHPKQLVIDGAERSYKETDDGELTIRVYDLVESWESLSIGLEVRCEGALRSKEISAIARVVCSASPSRHAINLESDGSCWKGSLVINRESYRGTVRVTGEFLAGAAKSTIAQPRATYEASTTLNLILDPVEAPPTGSIKPRWVDFVNEADRYQELKALDTAALKAATSLLAFHVDSQDWHWIWNKANDGWRAILPDRRPFGTAFNARRAVATSDFVGFVRSGLQIGMQSNIAELYLERSAGKADTVLERPTSTLLREVSDWALREYFKPRATDVEDEGVEALLILEMDELPGELSPGERSELLLSRITATVTAGVHLRQESSDNYSKVRDALIRSNVARLE
jgi:hypothetical protein